MTIDTPRLRLSERVSSWLHFLRWISAFLVCITHVRPLVLQDYSQEKSHNIFSIVLHSIHGAGHQAVMLFFVLSGFFIAGEVVREFHFGTFRWSDYAVKRISRLIPAYVLALALTSMLDRIGIDQLNAHGLYSGKIGGPMLTTNYTEFRSTPILVGNLLFLQGLLVPTYGTNVVLWSLASEAWYYLLFPLGMSAVSRSVPVTRRVVHLGLLMCGLQFIQGPMLLQFSVWLLGLWPAFFSQFAARRLWVPLACVAALLASERVGMLSSFSPIGRDVLAGVIWAHLIAAIQRDPRASIGTSPIHRRLADFSYSLYLIHWPVGLFLCGMVQASFGWGLKLPLTVFSFGYYMCIIVAIYLAAYGFASLTEFHTVTIRNTLSRFMLRRTRPSLEAATR